MVVVVAVAVVAAAVAVVAAAEMVPVVMVVVGRACVKLSRALGLFECCDVTLSGN